MTPRMPEHTPFVNVIVDISAQSVDRVFVYSVPEGLCPRVGHRVLAPFGTRSIEGYVVELLDGTEFPPERIRPIAALLDDEPAILPELVALAHWMKAKYRCQLVDCLRLFIPAQMRGGAVKPLERRYISIVQQGLGEADFKRAPLQWKLYGALSVAGGGMFVSHAEQALGNVRSAAAAMVKKGVLAEETRTLRRMPAQLCGMNAEALLTPTRLQRAAIDEMTSAMDGGGGRFLLHGVTGSGKTEVYCHLVKHALDMGKQAIVLVPEIALTPQMVMWFTNKFGDTAAVLHSRLSAGERFDEWWRIRTGAARVVVGARSAVFAPMSGLGVIVVDEEHESSYSSEHTPKYDAREVAVRRAEADGAIVVLGSATPQIKTYMNALRGYYTLLELRERVTGKPMPEVQIVDMRRELALGNRSMFSAPLTKALRECFARGEQAMLLMNRRGYNTFVSCRSCGQSVKCPACDITLTYHRAKGRLACHYCGYEAAPPERCPQCGSSLIRYFGSGSEKIEEEAARLFPDIAVGRMDADTTAGKDGHREVLERFRSGQTRLLVGTQMIAKGHDFPQVTVVGVLAADMTLSYPDYRSPERTFQLLTQVAGRAGRASKPGHVFFQTYEPEHYAIALAARQDYRAFYNAEIDVRRRGQYPPYTVYSRLLFTGGDEGALVSAAEKADRELSAWLYAEPDQRRLLLHKHAMETPIGYIKGRRRYQLFVKINARAPDAILDKLRTLAEQPYEDAECELEINPTAML